LICLCTFNSFPTVKSMWQVCELQSVRDTEHHSL
jgi:hypothetical protein